MPSVLDAGGRNIFAGATPADSTDLRHAIRGLLDTLADGMAICAPGPNSYRRFRPEAYVPMTATWSVNNRGSALRVPVSDSANQRIEHRLAGADANPYLVVAWMLAGIPSWPRARRGTAAAARRQRLPPVDGRAAADLLAASARSLRGERFRERVLRRAFHPRLRDREALEMEDFHSHVTPLEIERWLGPI